MLLSTRESTLETINVGNVGKPSSTVQMWLGTREFTMERIPMNVKNGGQPSARAPTSFSTRGFTLGRRHTCARSADAQLATAPSSVSTKHNTSVSTPGRSLWVQLVQHAFRALSGFFPHQRIHVGQKPSATLRAGRLSTWASILSSIRGSTAESKPGIRGMWSRKMCKQRLWGGYNTH